MDLARPLLNHVTSEMQRPLEAANLCLPSRITLERPVLGRPLPVNANRHETDYGVIRHEREDEYGRFYLLGIAPASTAVGAPNRRGTALEGHLLALPRTSRPRKTRRLHTTYGRNTFSDPFLS